MPPSAFLPALSEPRLGSGFDLARYLLVVGGLLAALAFAAWGGRRLLAGSLRSRAAKRSLTVVDVLPLGGRRQLAVVRCYDRTFVLGLGEKDVRLVAELDAAAEPRATPSDAAPAPPRAADAEERRFEALVERARERLDEKVRAGERGRGAAETPPAQPPSTRHTGELIA